MAVAEEGTVAAVEESVVAAAGLQACSGQEQWLCEPEQRPELRALATSLAVGAAQPSASLRPPAQTSFASDPLGA